MQYPSGLGHYSKMYIAVHEDVDDFMVPTLVAHAILGKHLSMVNKTTTKLHDLEYFEWLDCSFKKVVVRVNQKEFDKIATLPDVYSAYERTQMQGKTSCLVWLYTEGDLPNVLKFAKLWKPKGSLTG